MIHNRKEYDPRWDRATDENGNTLWIDKENQKVHRDDSSLTGILFDNQVGKVDHDQTHQVFHRDKKG